MSDGEGVLGGRIKLRGQVRRNGGLNILVVDDDDFNQRLLNLVLARDNNAITFSYNGYEAIKIIEQNHFDLIFMDIQIPSIDGFEVCEYVRTGNVSNKDTPIIALTALPSRVEKMQDYLDRGMFDDCIHKPFDIETIQEILIAVAEQKESGQKLTRSTNHTPANGSMILNVKKVLPIFGNDIEMYKELFDKFFATLPERLENIKKSEEIFDWKNLSIFAHNLTGVTRSFGAEKISALAEELDRVAAQENATAVQRLVEEIDKCVPELAQASISLTQKDLP